MKPPEEVCKKRSAKHDALSWVEFADTLISHGPANGNACSLAYRGMDQAAAVPLPTQAAERPDAAQAVRALYDAHYRSLVGLAVLLLREPAAAEDVVQDAFVAMFTALPRLRHADNALAYLRRSVINRSRSLLRHRAVERRYAPPSLLVAASAEAEAVISLEGSAVVDALRRLSARQREALVLRYYADLCEADIAKAMGVTRGAVKTHTARGMSALRSALEQPGSLVGDPVSSSGVRQRLAPPRSRRRDVEDVARPSPNPAAELSSSTTGCSARPHRGGTHDSRHMLRALVGASRSRRSPRRWNRRFPKQLGEWPAKHA
jgi:RNA polymerase sigma-70 factor (sigma-E family)